MQVAEAQREVRSVYLGGSVGQLVSGLLWLVSAALGTWVSSRSAIATLLFGGCLIFPLTTLGLKLLGGRAALARDNPLGALGAQIAFTVPIGLLVALGATRHRLEWFYPACMLIVGAHYLPFVFLYGMRIYALLAALLVAGGVLLGLYLPVSFALGGWLVGGMLLAFALLLRVAWAREARGQA